GFVGSHLVKRLASQGKAVRGLVHNPVKARRRLAGIELELVQGDVTEPVSLRRVMEGVDTVIHLVAIAIEKGGHTYEAINYQGTLNVMEAARAAGVKRFIFMSQLGADSRLPYPFLRSKGMAQEAVAGSDFAWTIFRPAVIFGPEDQFANVLARLILLTPLVFPIVGHGRTRFQPVWVEDVARCVVAALEDEGTVGQIYELAGPQVLTYEDMVDIVMETIGARRLKLHVPVPLLRPVVKLMEAALPRPPVTTGLLALLNVDNTTRENAIQRVFGIEPAAFEPANLGYMRTFTRGQALRRLFI
ncbi:MAG: complex I NDUFA9 subunit family protein, partial [Anaerolineae bacterium]